jgi:hypothetical protein
MGLTGTLCWHLEGNIQRCLATFGLTNQSVHGMHGSLNAMEQILQEALAEEQDLENKMSMDFEVTKDHDKHAQRHSHDKSDLKHSIAEHVKRIDSSLTVNQQPNQTKRGRRVSMFVCEGVEEEGQNTMKKRSISSSEGLSGVAPQPSSPIRAISAKEVVHADSDAKMLVWSPVFVKGCVDVLLIIQNFMVAICKQ